MSSKKKWKRREAKARAEAAYYKQATERERFAKEHAEVERNDLCDRLPKIEAAIRDAMAHLDVMDDHYPWKDARSGRHLTMGALVTALAELRPARLRPEAWADQTIT